MFQNTLWSTFRRIPPAGVSMLSCLEKWPPGSTPQQSQANYHYMGVSMPEAKAYNNAYYAVVAAGVNLIIGGEWLSAHERCSHIGCIGHRGHD